MENPLPQVESQMLTYMRVGSRPHCHPLQLSRHRWRGDRGERHRKRELPWVACQWEFAGSSAGESCCLSLHFLSKATYLTPPLLHSYCQVTTPAHPLLHSQPLTQLKKARMTHRILLKCLLLPPKRCWVFIAESRIAHDR